MEVKERKTRRWLKPPFLLLLPLSYSTLAAWLSLTGAGSLLIGDGGIEGLRESFLLRYTSEMFLCSSAELTCGLSRELSPLSL